MIYSLTCIQIEIILVWFWNPDSEDRYRHNNSLVHAAVSQVREEWKHRTRGDEEAYFPRVKRRSTPVARRNSKKFIGASSPRGGRWKWNRWRRRRRTLERWYGRHVAERRLSATGREFVVDRFTMKKKSFDLEKAGCHTRARARLSALIPSTCYSTSDVHLTKSIIVRRIPPMPFSSRRSILLLFIGEKHHIQSRFSRSRQFQDNSRVTSWKVERPILQCI